MSLSLLPKSINLALFPILCAVLTTVLSTNDFSALGNHVFWFWIAGGASSLAVLLVYFKNKEHKLYNNVIEYTSKRKVYLESKKEVDGIIFGYDTSCSEAQNQVEVATRTRDDAQRELEALKSSRAEAQRISHAEEAVKDAQKELTEKEKLHDLCQKRDMVAEANEKCGQSLKVIEGYVFALLLFVLAFACLLQGLIALKVQKEVLRQDRQQIEALIEGEGSWVGDATEQVETKFDEDACYLAQGNFDDLANPDEPTGTGKDLLVTAKEKNERKKEEHYYDIAKRWSKYLYLDQKKGKGDIAKRFAGVESESDDHVPVVGDGQVYKHSIEPAEIDFERDSTFAFAKTQTSSRDASKNERFKIKYVKEKLKKPSGEPLDTVDKALMRAKNHTAWVFIRMPAEAREWKVLRIVGGLNESERDQELRATRQEVRRSGKLNDCNFISNISLPKEPLPEEQNALKFWLRKKGFRDQRRGEFAEKFKALDRYLSFEERPKA